ncbi:hypothetical protein [Streptomyces sp. NPDC058683]|uniref:hypothetical protein n=1 Tax=Streptomyces sp. NPDC058683 TaxID=3346597 RepID=UPI003657AE51
MPGVLRAVDHARHVFDDADSIALCLRTRRTRREGAVFGTDAQNLIGHARRVLTMG